MTTYRYDPKFAAIDVDWNTPADWAPSVPNTADADVVISSIPYSGSNLFRRLIVEQNESYAVSSVSVSADLILVVNGALSISGALTLAPSYGLVVGGSLQVGSLSDAGLGLSIQVAGRLSSPNGIQTDAAIFGPGLVQFGAFTTSGSLDSITLITPASMFGNLVNGILSGGTYEATTGALTLNVGDDIVVDAARLVVGMQAIETVGAGGSIDPLGQTLRSVAAGGLLQDVGSYAQTAPLSVSGTVQLTAPNGLGVAGTDGPSFDGDGITVASGGLVEGAGTISGPIAIMAGGVVQATIYPSGFTFDQMGTLVLTGPVSGQGTLTIQATPHHSTAGRVQEYFNTLELAAQTSSNVAFGDFNGTLQLDGTALFIGQISGFVDGLDGGNDHNGAFYTYDHSATIVERGVALGSISNYDYAGDGAGGTLTVQQTNGSSFSLDFTGSYTTGDFTLTDGPASLGTPQPAISITHNGYKHGLAAQDFNGDGTSDLVLQNDNGLIVLLTTQNLAVTGSYSFGDPGGSWHAVGIADLDGNGTPDVLFQHDNGAIVDYLTTGGNGTQVAGGFLLDNPGSAWHVRGTGDFNGDGKADIVLQNDSGLIVVDYTNGGARDRPRHHQQPGPQLDGGGGGRPQRQTGASRPAAAEHQRRAGRLPDESAPSRWPATSWLTNPGTQYSVSGIGDYNADGFGDLVLHNDNGDGRGGRHAGPGGVRRPRRPWGTRVRSSPTSTPGIDLNGDGVDDLVLGSTKRGRSWGWTSIPPGTAHDDLGDGADQPGRLAGAASAARPWSSSTAPARRWRR